MTTLLQRDRRRSRYLLDCSPRYAVERGTLTAIGGQAMTLTRAGVGTAVDSAGRVYTAAYGQPRFEWVDLDGDGVRETVGLLLEHSGNNLVQQNCSIGTSPWGITSTPVITANAGVYAGVQLSRIASATAGFATQNVTLTGDGVKAVSALVKSDGVAGTSIIGLYDNTSAAWRCVIQLTFSAAGAVVAAAVVGTLKEFEPLADGVYRIKAQSTACTASHSHTYYSNNSGFLGTATSFLEGGVQVEDGPVPSSLIITGAATGARVTDLCSVAYNALPFAQTLYVNLIDRGFGDANVAAAGLALVENASDTGARMGIAAFAGSYQTFMVNDAAASNNATIAAPLSSFGNQVEVAARMYTSGTLDLQRSINGGAVSLATSAVPIAPPSAFSAPSVWINSAGSAGAIGLMLLLGLRIASGVQPLDTVMRQG